MSLSDPKITNPCKKFIEFKGQSGVFQYYDKEKEKNIELEKPISFIVLDELCTITGYSDQFQCGIYSNEVRSLSDEILNVRTFKGGAKIVGKYADIKPEVNGLGGKFTKSVYVALIKGDSLELVNFRFKGISFKAWMDAVVDKSSFAVRIEGCTDGKKGRVEFKIPNFKPSEIPKGLLDKAVIMDKDLQVFLKEYTHQQAVKDEAVQQHPKDEVQEEPPF